MKLIRTLSLQQQLRTMTGISLLGMSLVIGFVMFNLYQLGREFNTYQSLLTIDKSLIEIKATALAVSRGDPILLETATQLEQADSHIRELQQRMISSPTGHDLQKQLDGVAATWASYAQGMRGAIKIATTSPADALQIPDAMYSMHLSPMVNELDTMVAANKAVEASSETRINGLMSRIFWVVILPMLLIGGMTTVTQYLFGRHLRKRLEQIAGEIDHLHNGDLSRRLSVDNNDEVSQLSRTINNFITRFEAILHEVHCSADRTHKTAHGVSQMAHSVSANAKEQSDKVFQVSGAIEGLGNTIKTIAANAANASDSARRTLTLVQSGGETGRSTIQALSQIDQTVASSVHTMDELNTAIQRVGKATRMIREIAEQTNLLALNAAIEAARAGEQGRGFAVVADEVRKLAERTANATTEISGIVQLIEGETEAASKAMSMVKDEVAQGVRHGEEMGRLLHQIEDSVHLVTELMRQIAASTEDQSAAGEDIWRNIGQVASISADTASNIELARNEMMALADTSKALYETVGQFKLARVA